MTVFDDALTALIRTVPDIAAKTWVTLVPAGVKPTNPYCMVHPSRGNPSSERLAGPHSTQRPRWTLHVVSNNVANVDKVVGLLEQVLHPGGVGVILAVAGYSCGQLSWSCPLPLQVDNDSSPPLIYQVIELSLTADPV